MFIETSKFTGEVFSPPLSSSPGSSLAGPRGVSDNTTKGIPMLDVKNSKFGKFDGAAVARFLRQAFPTGTAQNVSTMTGIPTSTVDKWLRGDAAPSSAHLGILAGAFGPGFLAAAFPVARPWLEPERRHERVAQAVAEFYAAVSAALELAR